MDLKLEWTIRLGSGDGLVPKMQSYAAKVSMRFLPRTVLFVPCAMGELSPGVIRCLAVTAATWAKGMLDLPIFFFYLLYYIDLSSPWMNLCQENLWQTFCIFVLFIGSMEKVQSKVPAWTQLLRS